MSNWQSYLETQQTRFVQELCEFLTIPSISSLPQNKADVAKAAEWVLSRLSKAGMENVEIVDTGGHPLVYGDWLHAPGKPTVLIYGHFDVQPVDPVNLWTNPPFEPTLRNERVYARGASDDKGNMLAPILALEALFESGSLPVNIKCMFEGEEEIGSPSLASTIQKHRDKFTCDVVLSADGGQWDEQHPAILLSLRGLCGIQIDVYGASRDVHSGLYGGAIQNPIHALVELLDSMRTPSGNIAVEGFYDNVAESSESDRAAIEKVPFSEEALKTNLGLEEQGLFGEAGYSPHEQTWIRPTLEINGIWGGFQGEGTKTVIPAVAHAKITCRLVSKQQPSEIQDCLEAHCRKHLPPGVRIEFTRFDGDSPAYEIPADHSVNKLAAGVLTSLYGTVPYYVRGGGSIPFCNILWEQLGVHTVNFAFALDDENFHAPDEFFRLSSFKKAQTAYCMLLSRMGE